MLFVPADSWKTFDEFVKAAKAKPLAGGLSGRGSTTHLVGLIAMDELDIKANWVPYEGSAGSVAALECYEVGHLDEALALLSEGRIDPPIHLQFVLGVPGGMLFKRITKPVGPLGNSTFIGLSRLIRESYAMYRALDPAAFHEGAVGQARTKLAEMRL